MTEPKECPYCHLMKQEITNLLVRIEQCGVETREMGRIIDKLSQGNRTQLEEAMEPRVIE